MGGKEKIWRLPYNKYVLNELSILGCTFPNFFDKYIEKTAISVPEPKQPLPLKAKPYSYQTDGYALACDMMGISLIQKKNHRDTDLNLKWDAEKLSLLLLY